MLQSNMERGMRYLTFTLVLVAAVVAGSVGLAKYSDYQYQRSPQGLVESTKAAKDQNARGLVQERVDTLAANRCESPVLRVLQQHKAKPIASSSEIPTALRTDLDLCFERKIIGSFFIQELKDAGLLPMLQNSVS
jgi:hypothetical protein